MKRSLQYGWLVVGLCVGLLVVGCASYYKVTDPQSGNAYYTEKIENVMGGAVKVKDARTGSIVTLQNSEVKEISEKDYKAGLAAPVSKPAPASAPTPTAAPAAVIAPAAAPAPAAAAEPSSTPTGTKWLLFPHPALSTGGGKVNRCLSSPSMSWGAC
jgi:uncharacterized protein YceK